MGPQIEIPQLPGRVQHNGTRIGKVLRAPRRVEDHMHLRRVSADLVVETALFL